MTTMMPLDQFQKIRHIDEIVKMGETSWWVKRRTLGFNGTLSSSARMVFFGRTQEQVEQWMAAQ